jgi:ketosteroid isomerase-like protein
MSTTVGVHGVLESFYARWNAAFDEKDAAAFVYLYAADARLIPPLLAGVVRNEPGGSM